MVIHTPVYFKNCLYRICMRDALLLWLKSFLSNRSQLYVVIDNQKSHCTEALSGVLQDTVLAFVTRPQPD